MVNLECSSLCLPFWSEEFHPGHLDSGFFFQAHDQAVTGLSLHATGIFHLLLAIKSVDYVRLSIHTRFVSTEYFSIECLKPKPK